MLIQMMILRQTASQFADTHSQALVSLFLSSRLTSGGHEGEPVCLSIVKMRGERGGGQRRRRRRRRTRSKVWTLELGRVSAHEEAAAVAVFFFFFAIISSRLSLLSLCGCVCASACARSFRSFRQRFAHL